MDSFYSRLRGRCACLLPKPRTISTVPDARAHPRILERLFPGRGFDRAESAESLLRAVRYGAARLIQTAFEQTQRSAALTGNVVCLLHLSFNILQRPHEAAAQLLGLPG